MVLGKRSEHGMREKNLLGWRETWACLANEHLSLHGDLILKIDHRTLRAQGIDLEPQHKIGASIAKQRLARLEDHQRIARENGQKILENPQIVLNAITCQQSTFTHQDIARFVNRHTVGAAQFQQVYEKVKDSDHLLYLGMDDHHRERFTTREMLAIRTQMLECVRRLQCQSHAVSEAIKLHAFKLKRADRGTQACL